MRQDFLSLQMKTRLLEPEDETRLLELADEDKAT
jgi:hypothetical protein